MCSNRPPASRTRVRLSLIHIFLSIDTREAFRTLTVKIDGTVYTMRPLGSKDMLTILDNAETIDKLSRCV